MLDRLGRARIDVASLAWQIARCPYFQAFDAGQAGVCTDVIAAQGKWRRTPEGWTGRLLEAPILFVTSNPNTDVETPGSDPVFQTPEELATFNDVYFDHHPVSGTETWNQMRKWATTLRGGRDTVAGRDFALTDAVRCASPKQAGVEAALGRCAGCFTSASSMSVKTGASIPLTLGPTGGIGTPDSPPAVVAKTAVFPGPGRGKPRVAHWAAARLRAGTAKRVPEGVGQWSP